MQFLPTENETLNDLRANLISTNIGFMDSVAFLILKEQDIDRLDIMTEQCI